MNVPFRLLFFSALILPTAFGQCRGSCTGSTRIWAKDRKSDVPLFRVVKDEKVGYIDSTGRLVIPHQFDLTFNYYWDFIEGLAPVQSGQHWGFIDPTGKFVIAPIFDSVEPFSEGRALVSLGRDRHGLIDKNGEFVGDSKGANGPFVEGYAMQWSKEKWGFIDRSGEIGIEPRFAWASPFSEGLASVVEKGGCVIFEDDCRCRDVGLDRTRPSNPTAPVPACQLSYIDKRGKTVLTGYQNAQQLSEGLAAVRTFQKWGFIRKDGSMAIREQFERVEPFQDGLAAVRMDDKWGFIDATGKVVTTPQFDYAKGFSEGVGLVRVNQRSVFIDRNGKQLFGREFWFATPFALGLAHVSLGAPLERTWAYINHEGAIVYEYSARQ